MNRAERLALVDHDDPVLPVAAQCRLLKVARSTLYYQPVPASPDDLAVMRRIDELHLECPFYGSRRMAVVLRRRRLGGEPQARPTADAGDGAWRRSIRNPTPAGRIRTTRCTLICCGA